MFANVRIRSMLAALVVIGAGAAFWFGGRELDRRPVHKSFAALAVDEFLTVRIEPRRECQSGELDLMLSSVKSGVPLIATLEPILPQDASFARLAKSIDRDMLLAPLGFSLRLPPRKTSSHLGVFICSDKENTKSCAGKAVYSFDDVYDKQLGRPSPIRSGDSVYFFQYVVANSASLQFVTSEADYKSAQQGIEAALKREPPADAKLAPLILKRATDNLMRLGSLTLAPASDSGKDPTLVVPMTKFDTSYCPVSTQSVKKVSADSVKPAALPVKRSK